MTTVALDIRQESSSLLFEKKLLDVLAWYNHLESKTMVHFSVAPMLCYYLMCDLHV